MQASPLITLSPSSPSFNSFSSNKLAEIAARVVQELTTESEQEQDTKDNHNNIFSWHQNQEGGNKRQNENQSNEEDEGDDGDDFEFAVLTQPQPQFSTISADDIFYNGQIRPFYPVFNTKLLLDQEPKKSTTDNFQETKKSTRLPLRKLFYEDRDSFSCSSSEADDLDSAEPGSYCVWTPKKEDSSLGSCKKSNSTGSSSRRWKFRDLLYRSNSDGKDSFMFLACNNSKKMSSSNERVADHHHHQEGNKEKKKEGKGFVQLQQHYYAKSKGGGGGDKRRSTFLPYRQDLVGFLSNVNGVGRNPF